MKLAWGMIIQCGEHHNEFITILALFTDLSITLLCNMNRSKAANWKRVNKLRRLPLSTWQVWTAHRSPCGSLALTFPMDHSALSYLSSEFLKTAVVLASWITPFNLQRELWLISHQPSGRNITSGMTYEKSISRFLDSFLKLFPGNDHWGIPDLALICSVNSLYQKRSYA